MTPLCEEPGPEVPPARIRLAVTLGDPRGVGPEVAAKALAATRDEAGLSLARADTLVIGPGNRADDFDDLCPFEAVECVNEPGRTAGLAIERAVALALAGRVDGIVTAPVHKPALAAAGFLPGHTEMLMTLAGVSEVGMLMCDEGDPASGMAPRRVLLATIHIPLAEVPTAVTPELLISQTRLLTSALTDDWGLAHPRIAICALNPHASDEGMFGSEERTVFAPAVAALARSSAQVTGPLPADTVFARAFAGEFDAVVAPYHDVGMAAFKTASFGRGVNATLGLPFVRTSPDHGTAFDIAGRGVADPSSMIAAIRLATHLALHRRSAPGAVPA